MGVIAYIVTLSFFTLLAMIFLKLTGVTPVQHNEWDNGMIAIIGVGSMFVIGCIILIISSIDFEKEKDAKENIKRFWDESWKRIKINNGLEEIFLVQIEHIKKTISNLLPLLQEEKMQEELHHIIRMKEKEIPRLVQSFVKLEEEKQKEERHRFEKALTVMQKEIYRIQDVAHNRKRNNFEQHVRVIEKQYEKTKDGAFL